MLLTKLYCFPSSSFLHAVVGQLTESQRATDMCQSYCNDMGIPYFRFNVPFDKEVSSVIKHTESVVELLLKTRQHLQDSPQLRELVLQLHDLAANGQKLQDILGLIPTPIKDMH